MNAFVTSSNEIITVRDPASVNGFSFATTASRSAGQEKQSGALGAPLGGAGVGISGAAGERFGIHSIRSRRARAISASNSRC